jgi:hypothetical protein
MLNLATVGYLIAIGAIGRFVVVPNVDRSIEQIVVQALHVDGDEIVV